MHEVLVNRLGGLSLPRKSVVRLTDRPDMTLDVYRGCKRTIQQLLIKNFISVNGYIFRGGNSFSLCLPFFNGVNCGERTLTHNCSPESLSIQLNLHTHDAFCVFQDNLLLDMYLVSHVKTLYSQIRNRALCQVFQDFFTINNTVIENRTVWLHILTLITMETKTLIKH